MSILSDAEIIELCFSEIEFRKLGQDNTPQSVLDFIEQTRVLREPYTASYLPEHPMIAPFVPRQIKEVIYDLDTEARRAVYRSFFDRCAAWLPAGGRLSLQTIGYEDFDPARGVVSTFFTEDIFPESSLPSLSDIVVSAEPTFRMLALRSDGDQYERTLHLWQRRLQANEVGALAVVDRTTYRRYLRYLRVSRAMFDRHVCTLYRIALERRPNRRS